MLNSTCINPNYVNAIIKYRDYRVYNTPPGIHNGSLPGDEHLLAVTIGTTEGLITLSTFYRPFDETKPNSKIPHMLFNRLFNRSHPVILITNKAH